MGLTACEAIFTTSRRPYLGHTSQLFHTFDIKWCASKKYNWQNAQGIPIFTFFFLKRLSTIKLWSCVIHMCSHMWELGLNCRYWWTDKICWKNTKAVQILSVLPAHVMDGEAAASCRAVCVGGGGGKKEVQDNNLKLASNKQRQLWKLMQKVTLEV
jgi:hypothetical protein